MATVDVQDLSKAFGPVQAVDQVRFTVADGELFGLIGPDGAGKTTLFRMLVTLLTPDAGHATVDGLDVVRDYRRLRTRLGYMPGRFSLYQDLTVEENLTFFASVFGTTIREGYDLIQPIYHQIEPFKKRRAGALSGGMKQKLALSCALIHRPRILFLDEPTTGVDAVSRKEFWDVLADLKASGLTIVVSTPYMDEATRCDRVALMQHGRLLGVDTPAALQASYDRPLLAVRARQRYAVLQALQAFPHAFSVYAFGDALHYTDARASVDPAEIQDYLTQHGHADAVAEPIQASVEDTFMARMADRDAEPGPPSS